MKANQWLKEARHRLTGFSDAPDIDAQRILMAQRGITQLSQLILNNDSVLSANELAQLEIALKRRLAGEPLAYILGEWHFYGRPFTINPDVLVPRPETEKLVQKALHAAENLYQELGRRLTVADLGTGSGCIAVTLAIESAAIGKVVACDISAAALKVASINTVRHNAGDKVSLVAGDMIEASRRAEIDLLISNPPYVPSSELDRAGAEIDSKGLLFEPRLALDGGPDGNDYIKELMKTAKPLIYEGRGGEIFRFN